MKLLHFDHSRQDAEFSNAYEAMMIDEMTSRSKDALQKAQEPIKAEIKYLDQCIRALEEMAEKLSGIAPKLQNQIGREQKEIEEALASIAVARTRLKQAKEQ